jgi:CRISPR-associated protein Csd2
MNAAYVQVKVNLDVENIDPASMGLLPRYDVVVLWSVANGVGNIDPDGGGARIDCDDHEYVTNACFKRHIRDAMPLLFPVPGYEQYVSRGAVLESPIIEAFKRLGVASDELTAEEKTAGKKVKKARRVVDGRDIRADVRADQCRKFGDNRMFGAMLSPSKDAEAGRIKGPVQVFDASSIEVSMTEEICQTRVAVSDAARSEKMDGRNQDMGSRYRSKFTLFQQNMAFNPFLAPNTGFTQQDFDVLIKTISKMFGIGESGASATSGLRTVHKIVIFKHKSPYGNAQSDRLFKSIKYIKKNPDASVVCFEDYDIIIEKPPAGVEVEVIDPI